MAGPWEKYAKHPAPWEKFGGKPSEWSASGAADQIEAMRQPGTFSDATDSTLRGIIPFGEEIVAGMGALPRAGVEWMQGEGFQPGRAYTRNVETERELQRRRDVRSPIASTVGTVIGAVGSGGVAAKGGLTLMNAAKPTITSVVPRMAIESGIWGALYGAGEGEGLVDRGKKALDQGIKGAALGAGLGLGTRALTKIPEASKVTLNAFDKIKRAMLREGIDPATVSREMGRMGKASMPLDVGNALGEIGEGIASVPGTGQKVIRNALTRRADTAGRRVTASATKSLGKQFDMVSTVDDIIDVRKAAAAPLYKRALAKPVPFTKRLENLLNRPSVKSALTKAQRMAADDNVQSGNWFANVGANGKTTITNTPDATQLHYTKMAIDDKIGAAKRAGSNNLVRIYTGIKDELLDIMDTAIPEYKQARAAFSGPSDIIDALEGGKALFTKGMTPGDVRKLLKTMSPGERQAYARGARAAISDIMGTARNDANAARAVFEKGYNKEKLIMVAGKKNAEEMLNSLNSEKIFFGKNAQILGNSRTAPREAIIKDLGLGPKGETRNPVRKLFNMNFGDAAADTADLVMGKVNKTGVDKTSAEIARILTQRGGENFAQTAANLPKISASKKALADAIMRISATSDPYGAYKQNRKK